METRTQGDVKIFMLPNGIEIKYQGGQPLMDQGFSNMVLILLFTERGWPLNKILPESQQIGSDFLEECRKPITVTQLRKIEISAQAALSRFDSEGIGFISNLSVRILSGVRIFLSFVLNPPSGDCLEICLTGFGRNWELQATEAA